ncbi:ABC transporter ATP-binding protein [Nocardiopsis quinghaiensis]|uniref:ABC transporter ATP-binding protein n=1 Tax=Nocardiopsis quinghaiensis TaxID=464995 RepID=UPI00123A2FCA|nr:ABC transporter ATP-binding protein [Nocardiopsis quinghaiensis]
MEKVVAVVGLTKSYGDVKVVDDVSFSIGEGEVYGLLGPNGAGKTTTISMVMGILRPDAGEVSVGGIPHGPEEMRTKALIGFVPQQNALYEDLTAVENLHFFAKLYGIPRAEAGGRVDEVLAAVGLTDRANEAVSQYSGGMARRANIAAGLMNRPRFLVLDEPTAGVDPQSRSAILEHVRALADSGVAVLYTTHYMEEAERLCDRIGVLDDGRLVAEGTRRELVTRLGERDRIDLAVDGSAGDAARLLEALPGVHAAAAKDGGVELSVDNASELSPAIVRTLAEEGFEMRSLQVREPDLEAVFLSLTGKALRD